MHPAPSIEPLRVQKQNTLKTWVLKNSLNNDGSSLCNTARLPLFLSGVQKKSRPWTLECFPKIIETPRPRESFKRYDLVICEIRATNYKQPNWTGRAYNRFKLNATAHKIKLRYFILTFLYQVIFIEKFNLVSKKNNPVISQVRPRPVSLNILSYFFVHLI